MMNKSDLTELIRLIFRGTVWYFWINTAVIVFSIGVLLYVLK